MATENCEIGISGNFDRICGYTPKQGIKNKWYGNVEDIDVSATVMANRGNLVTTLVLKTGAKLYRANGTDKSHQLTSAAVIGDFGNGHKHTDILNVIYRGADERERIQESTDGARLFSIVEKVDKGPEGKEAFEIAGLESGMLLAGFDYDSNANSGVGTLTVATKDGEEESTPPKLFLDTDYATTLTFLETNTFDPNA